MTKRRLAICILGLALGISAFALQGEAVNGGYTLLAWNNLGMHCMDSDYSVFSILPPYNVINAQLIDANGRLVRTAGITVTYEAIEDLDGSINATSTDKTNFWQFVGALFGASLAVDYGLAGYNMPGAGNAPQSMTFSSASQQFVAEGIPLTPYDDAGRKNFYPMMHLVARDSLNRILAATDIVLPVSDEMDCRACHASDTSPAARPENGWVYDPIPERDYRLNILLRHDQNLRAFPGYQTILAAAGYSPQGLYATVVDLRKPILCAGCHASNALNTVGAAGVPPLTQAVHALHAHVTDPINGETLDSNTNRAGCYRCHPGSATRCLRGAMGSAVAPDGSLAIQCQDCHGGMSAVGAAGRQGWLEEPTCQNCHTGTAVQNSGQIRYTSAFDTNGKQRVPASNTFATNPNMPGAGLSLYRFSTGHGGLQCEACHGATHAEYASLDRNDNIQSLHVQGHVGMISDCFACHNTQPNTINGGPHGMHPVGQQWANSHGDAVERSGSSMCRPCHGTDSRGTVLSRSLGDRTLSTRFGIKQLWRGFQVGCYTCHNGPSSESGNPNRAPVAADAAATTNSGTPVDVQLNVSDADNNPLSLHIVSQPAHGTVALNNRLATFMPNPDYTGADSFTFAAWDGSVESNLATVTLSVASRFFIPFYQADAGSYTGIAISNYSGRMADVQLAAFGAGGNLLPFPDNPSSFTLQPFSQLARLGSQFFGTDLSTPQAGWVQVSGDVGELGCLYEIGDFAMTGLDGAAAAAQPARQLVFTRVFEGPGVFRGQSAVTFLSIANPTTGPITMTLSLLGSDAGQALAPPQTMTLPAKGAVFGTVTELFKRSLLVSGGWVNVEVTAGDGAVGFELIRFPGPQSVIGLNAVSGGAINQFYSAQLAITPQYFTSIKLINTSTMARTATLHAIADDGSELAQPSQVHLDVGQSLEQDAGLMLGLAQGVASLRVDASGPGIIGDVVFGDPAGLNFASYVQLQSQKFSQAVFSHVANTAGYFTGLALLNPDPIQTASVTLDVYPATGGTPVSGTIQLGPGRRISRLLDQLVPATAGQGGGYIMLRSTIPLVGMELLGDTGMRFLSAVPPRIVN